MPAAKSPTMEHQRIETRSRLLDFERRVLPKATSRKPLSLNDF
jgi:hypothetical protein